MEVEDRFTALYRAHYPAVLRYACRRTDPDSASDIAAETFMIAWRRIGEMPADPGLSGPWLYGVARRVLANAERSSRRNQRVTARLWHEGETEYMPDPAVAVAERQRVVDALDRLSEPDREALRLVGWEGLDLAGAALAMGCSRSAMAVRLHRARRRLDRALGAVEPGAVDPGAAGGAEHQVSPLPRRQAVVQHESR